MLHPRSILRPARPPASPYLPSWAKLDDICALFWTRHKTCAEFSSDKLGRAVSVAPSPRGRNLKRRFPHEHSYHHTAQTATAVDAVHSHGLRRLLWIRQGRKE